MKSIMLHMIPLFPVPQPLYLETKSEDVLIDGSLIDAKEFPSFQSPKEFTLVCSYGTLRSF